MGLWKILPDDSKWELVAEGFAFTDDISGITNEIIYYKLKVIAKNGDIKYSNVLVVRRKQTQTLVNIMPNPANNYVNINLYANVSYQAKISLIDNAGRKILVQNEKLNKGYNNISLPLEKYSEGMYTIVIETPSGKINRRLIIIR